MNVNNCLCFRRQPVGSQASPTTSIDEVAAQRSGMPTITVVLVSELPPNHHADYPQFGGVFGYVAGLTMIAGRGGDGRLVTDLAQVSADDHVLDIGCGPGTAARIAAGPAGRVSGVDPSEPMLRLARLLTRGTGQRAPIEWIAGGAEALPLPDRSVTVCWSLASVHHWPELEPGIAEVRRVLQPGGLFLALEKVVEPGATGNASHGWTDAQAKLFASMLTQRGFDEATVDHRVSGRRRQVVVVSAR